MFVPWHYNSHACRYACSTLLFFENSSKQGLLVAYVDCELQREQILLDTLLDVISAFIHYTCVQIYMKFILTV